MEVNISILSKSCTICEQTKTLSQYYVNKQTKDGRNYRCKECENKVRMERYNNNPDRDRWRQLKRRFNLESHEYNELLIKQEGKCAICKQPESSIDTRNNICRKLAVDHCHKTGKIRGLLCMRCNLSISMFDKNPELIATTYNYLTLYKERI